MLPPTASILCINRLSSRVALAQLVAPLLFLIPADAKVQEAACNALCCLAANPHNKVKVAAEGGVGAIVSAMQHHPTHAKIQHAGCGALLNLTLNSANKAKAKSAGAEDAVKRAMALQDATAKTKEKGQKVLDRLKNV